MELDLLREECDEEDDEEEELDDDDDELEDDDDLLRLLSRFRFSLPLLADRFLSFARDSLLSGVSTLADMFIKHSSDFSDVKATTAA